MMLVRLILCVLLVMPGFAQADRAIFYQPQARDIDVESTRWPVIFRAVKEQGIDTVIVQWTAYGDAFAQEQKRSWLKDRLDDAIQAGLNVVVGLDADPELFVRLEQPASVLADYFRKQRSLDTKLAQYWFGILPHEKISGWYITLEIDDRRWRDQSALNVLQNHLQTEAKALQAIGQKPVYISSFFAGNMEPSLYAGMLGQIKREADIRILVQDGAGTARLSERERELYLNALSDCKAPVVNGIVYEIFRQTRQDREFEAEPLAPEQRREVLKKRSPCGQETVLFSLRYLIELVPPKK